MPSVKRLLRTAWIEGAKNGIEGGNFSMTPYPLATSTSYGYHSTTYFGQAREWARGYWWSQRCLQGSGKRVQSKHRNSPRWGVSQSTSNL